MGAAAGGRGGGWWFKDGEEEVKVPLITANDPEGYHNTQAAVYQCGGLGRDCTSYGLSLISARPP